MKEKLVIVCVSQFGYHTDTFKYCEKLRLEKDVTYIGFDDNRKAIELEGVNIIYVQRTKSNFLSLMKLNYLVLKTIKQLGNAKVFLVYYKTSSIIALLSRVFYRKSKINCDIRTLSLTLNDRKRNFEDKLLKFECNFFRNISVINLSLAKKIALTNVKELPLGADRLLDIEIDEKPEITSTQINLFYIGTLTGRNLYDTIEGLSLLVDKYPNIEFSYDIVGGGTSLDIRDIKNAVQKHNLDNVVSLHGRLSHIEAKVFFSNADLGICYYPQCEYFDLQPPTKLFEYVINGISCIAVDTSSTRNYITEYNGILIDAKPVSFANGIEKFIKNPRFSKDVISKSLEAYTWSNIVRRYLNKVLEEMK